MQAAVEHIKQQIHNHLDFLLDQDCLSQDRRTQFDALLDDIKPPHAQDAAVLKPDTQQQAEPGKYNALMREKLLEADLLAKITDRIPFFPAALSDILGEGSKDLATALTNPAYQKTAVKLSQQAAANSSSAIIRTYRSTSDKLKARREAAAARKASQSLSPPASSTSHIPAASTSYTRASTFAETDETVKILSSEHDVMPGLQIASVITLTISDTVHSEFVDSQSLLTTCRTSPDQHTTTAQEPSIDPTSEAFSSYEQISATAIPTLQIPQLPPRASSPLPPRHPKHPKSQAAFNDPTFIPTPPPLRKKSSSSGSR